MTRNTGCTADPPTPAGPVPATILDGLSAAIAKSQSALLSGRLPELEVSLVEQLEISRQLRSILPLTSASAAPALPSARSAQQQLRVFSATLYRMQRTLTALRHALQAAPLTYTPPAAGENWGR